MNWKIIPALAYITFFNLAVSCLDDLFLSSASSGTEVNAALVCSNPAEIDWSGERAFPEMFLGGAARWDKDGGIILAIIRESKAQEFLPGEDGEDSVP